MRGSLIPKRLIVGCAGVLLIGCEDVDRSVAPDAFAPTAPSFTMAEGVTAIDFGPGGTLARATFDGFNLKRIETEGHKRGWPHGRWEFGIDARPSVDMGVRSFEYAPGAYTGWHTHPGPVFIMVLEGTVTFYDSDDPACTPIVVHAGGTFLDTGEHAHIGRNETDEQARDLVVLFAPEGAPFRNDAPDPGHCPFSTPA
jgi:quercetin dioxygenase-like cupin family protein